MRGVVPEPYSLTTSAPAPDGHQHAPEDAEREVSAGPVSSLSDRKAEVLTSAQYKEIKPRHPTDKAR